MAGHVSATTGQSVGDIEPAAAWFGVGLALLVGGVVRVLPTLGTDFPLNDGGLFATMIEDLVANAFMLPAFTGYNGLDIPFAYPPLALYIAGFANQAFGIPILDILRFLPLMVSLATIPALYWLAQSILDSRSGGVLAALSFALLPRAYLWMITGGGVTRALGFLFAIVALGIAWRLLRSPEHRWWTAIMLGLVGGLTALAHPQAGVFMAVSILVFLPWAPRRREAAALVLAAGLVGMVVTSPWLVAIVGRHGFDPLLAAVQSGGASWEGLLYVLSLRFSELPVFDVISVAGLIGAVVAIRKREYLLPIWLFVILLADSRAGSTYSMVPLALLTAYCLSSFTWLPSSGKRPIAFATDHPLRTLTAMGLLVALIMANYLSVLRPTSPAFTLSGDQRDGMIWAANSTRESAQFAVVTGSPSWETDAASEWFPALTDRRSAATVQGYEWLGLEAWQRQQAAYEDLQACASDVLSCVVAWSAEYGVPVTHVFLPKGQLHGPLSDADCCLAPRHSVDLVPGARVIYDGPGATIIELP